MSSKVLRYSWFRSYGESTEIDAEIASQDSLINGTMSPSPHLFLSRDILVSLSWVFPFSIQSECLTPSSRLRPHQLQVQVQGMGPTHLSALVFVQTLSLFPLHHHSPPALSPYSQHLSLHVVGVIDGTILLRWPRIQKTELSFCLWSFFLFSYL